MADDAGTLPDPGSDELQSAVPNRVGQRIYEELFKAPDGLDIAELKRRVPEFADQMHFDRRLRDLDKFFVLDRKREGGKLTYRLAKRRKEALQVGRISKKLRAKLLYRDGGRCQMCGASPERDPRAQLQIDHRIPLQWGGTNAEDNLWVLCSECNTGKRDFFSSVDDHADQIKVAIDHAEVHRRIGELLRAFGPDGEVPGYLIEIVASSRQFQDDWQRRMRELRDLGWDYSFKKRKEGGRYITYYRLTNDGGWPPDGTSIRKALSMKKGKK